MHAWWFNNQPFRCFRMHDFEKQKILASLLAYFLLSRINHPTFTKFGILVAMLRPRMECSSSQANLAGALNVRFNSYFPSSC